MTESPIENYASATPEQKAIAREIFSLDLPSPTRTNTNCVTRAEIDWRLHHGYVRLRIDSKGVVS